MSTTPQGGEPRRRSAASILGRVICVLVLLAAAGALLLIYQTPKREGEAPPTEAPPVNVVVEVVQALPELADTLDLPGQVAANRVVQVAAEVAGRVEEIACQEGATCQADDRLVRLNADVLRAEFNGAKAEHNRLKAQCAGDRQDYERIRTLAESGAATQKQLDEAKTRLDVSMAAIEAAEAQINRAEAHLDRAEIVAPIGGVLNDVLIEKGEYVQAGTPVVEIVDMDTVKVVVQAPEPDIPFFRTGGEATVFVNGEGGEKNLVGKITYVSALADERTRSTRMEITLDNRERSLISGQIVRVRLTRRVLKNVIMVPLLAVIPMENAKAVYVVEDGRAERREVKLGFIKGRSVLIRDGLGTGDSLIVAGHRYVGPGQPVRVTPEE